MISASVTGRNWIFKNFDNEKITYIKENYDLDEITSKLLSIRNIENNQITSFLNPFIKNHMPNPNSIKDMKKTVERLISSIGNKEKNLLLVKQTTLLKHKVRQSLCQM